MNYVNCQVDSSGNKRTEPELDLQETTSKQQKALTKPLLSNAAGVFSDRFYLF